MSTFDDVGDVEDDIHYSLFDMHAMNDNYLALRTEGPRRRMSLNSSQ